MNDWLVGVAEFFISGGFFQGVGDDPARLAHQLETLYHEEWDEQPSASDDHIEQMLLCYDEDRAYYETLDADAAKGNAVYEAVLAALCAISLGELTVSDCVEEWSSTGEEAVITARLNSRDITIAVTASDGRIDLGFFSQLQAICRSLGTRIPKLMILEDFFLAVMLNDDEIERIERRPNWAFDV